MTPKIIGVISFKYPNSYNAPPKIMGHVEKIHVLKFLIVVSF